MCGVEFVFGVEVVEFVFGEEVVFGMVFCVEVMLLWRLIFKNLLSELIWEGWLKLNIGKLDLFLR